MTRRTGLLLTTAFLAGAVGAAPAARLLLREFAPSVAQATPLARQDDRAHALTLFGQVLEKVRADYVDPVSTQTLVHHALDGMLSGLDPHSGYMDAQQWHEMQLETRGSFGGLGMTVTGEAGVLKVISPIDGTPAARAGIKPGDLITMVNGKAIDGLTLQQAVDKLRGPPDTQVNLTIKRSGDDKPLDLTLTREIIHMQVVKSRLEGDIGYIRLTMFNDDTDRDLRAALVKLRKQHGGRLAGIVLDLRNNPGGLLDQAVAVADDFLNGGEIVSTRGRQDDDDHAWYAHSGDLTGGVPMVVLINNGSASAAEIVAGALQDNRRAVLLGTRSFGKGSVQTLFPLRGEGAIRLTTARYYTPSGRSIQAEGITPDVEMHQSDKREAQFGPEHESDLNNILHNPDTAKRTVTRPAIAAAAGLAEKPPADWPKYDPNKPETDFQLHQATILLRRIIAGPNKVIPTFERASPQHGPNRSPA